MAIGLTVGKLTLDSVARCAEQVLGELGIRALPVDPFAIAQHYEIECKGKLLQGCSGCLILRNGSFWIVYHNGWTSGFARFTVAHELGHFFIEGHPQILFPDDSGEHRSEGGFTSKTQHEREADHFAANLLMPAKLFNPALGSQSGRGFPAIEALAEQCGTSMPATAIRYAQLSDVPVAIIMSSGERIEFCFMSEPLKAICANWIPKGSIVPRESGTHGFNKDEANVISGQRQEASSYLDAWFDDAEPIEMKEDVVGLGQYGKTLTVLFLEEIPRGVEEDWG